MKKEGDFFKEICEFFREVFEKIRIGVKWFIENEGKIKEIIKRIKDKLEEEGKEAATQEILSLLLMAILRAYARKFPIFARYLFVAFIKLFIFPRIKPLLEHLILEVKAIQEVAEFQGKPTKDVSFARLFKEIIKGK